MLLNFDRILMKLEIVGGRSREFFNECELEEENIKERILLTAGDYSRNSIVLMIHVDSKSRKK